MQVARRTRIGKPWPLLELFKDKTSDSNKIVQGYLKPIVQSALRQKSARSHREKDNHERTFLDHLTDNTDGKISYQHSVQSSNVRSPLDPEAIAFQVLNMLLAGRDTVSVIHPE